MRFTYHLLVGLVLALFSLEGAAGYDCLKRPKVRYPFCLDKDEVRKGHTMCLGGIQKHWMNDTVMSEITDLHNSIRQSVTPPAADMIALQKISALEKEAQIWAEQCKMTHDKEELRFLSGRFSVGQNIYIGGPTINWTEAVGHWKKEKGRFKYGGPNNISEVASYTQIIFSETLFLGCGVSKCGSQHFYVCNYAPTLNKTKLDEPYLESVSGTWGDSCPGHRDNSTHKLCDCKGKLCVNGGRLNVTTCQCECIAAVNTYHKEFCDLICNPNGDDRRCGAPPFDNSTCYSSPETSFHCPWMCNVCPYAGKNYTEGSELLPWERGLPVCTTTTVSAVTPSAAFTLSTASTTVSAVSPSAALTSSTASTTVSTVSPLAVSPSPTARKQSKNCVTSPTFKQSCTALLSVSFLLFFFHG